MNIFESNNHLMIPFSKFELYYDNIRDHRIYVLQYDKNSFIKYDMKEQLLKVNELNIIYNINNLNLKEYMTTIQKTISIQFYELNKKSFITQTLDRIINENINLIDNNNFIEYVISVRNKLIKFLSNKYLYEQYDSLSISYIEKYIMFLVSKFSVDNITNDYNENNLLILNNLFYIYDIVKNNLDCKFIIDDLYSFIKNNETLIIDDKDYENILTNIGYKKINFLLYNNK